MTPEELSPADREIAQLALVRIWLARKKRARYQLTHGESCKVQRFDLQGKPRPPRPRR